MDGSYLISFEIVSLPSSCLSNWTCLLSIVCKSETINKEHLSKVPVWMKFKYLFKHSLNICLNAVQIFEFHSKTSKS